VKIEVKDEKSQRTGETPFWMKLNRNVLEITGGIETGIGGIDILRKRDLVVNMMTEIGMGREGSAREMEVQEVV